MTRIFHSIFLKNLLLHFLPLFLCTALFSACTNSDEYIFDERDSTPITVVAQIAKSFDSTASRTKADTISRGDSIIFVASVSPSNSIRIKNKYWQMDGKYFASEFNVRESINKPGYHEITFVLIDSFGDTLSDTVQLWVTSTPVLKTNDFIPANYTQDLPYNEKIQFVWNAYDSDSICDLHYHFVLTNIYDDEAGEDPMVDTVINKPYFNLDKALQPLSIYRWSVSAYNEYNIASKDSIKGEFSTLGIGNEGAITGKLNVPSQKLYSTFDITVFDLLNNPTGNKASTERSPSNGLFLIKPLKAGTYRIVAQSSKAPDFVSDTIRVEVSAGLISDIQTLKVQDKKAPVISLNGVKDSMDFDDTLRVTIKDGGGDNILANTTVYLDNKQTKSYTETKDGIEIKLNDNERSWTPQVLTIMAEDGSGNTTKKKIIVKPGTFWIDVSSDTTISEQGKVNITVKEHNPYDFEWYKCTINPFDDQKGIVNLETFNANSISYTISGSGFRETVNPISITAEYKNALSQTRIMNVTINRAPVMTYENCYSPCNVYTSSTAVFQWHPATDPENDSLLYRVIYVANSDTITDTTKFVYATDYISSTSVILQDLPTGALYWWVEAKDPYGGKSAMWAKKSPIVIFNQNTESSKPSTSKLTSEVIDE